MVDSVTKRTFFVVAGMTPQYVINSTEATAQQKKMAHVFDSDGIAGYSKREADVFNATSITDRGARGVSLWTRYANNSNKETKISKENIDTFKYEPKGNVKPYITEAEKNKLEIQFKNKLEIELKNKQKYINTLDIKEDCLTDKWPELLIYYDQNGNLISEDSNLMRGYRSQNYLDRTFFYAADIDNNDVIDNFEVIRYCLKQKHPNQTEEELLKNTLEAYKYFCVKGLPLDKEEVVNQHIETIKKYEAVINNPEKLEMFIKNQQEHLKMRIENYEKTPHYNSDIFFTNPQNTTIRYKNVSGGAPSARGKYVIREEYYPNGKLKTEFIKKISYGGGRYNAWVDVYNYNSKGKVVSKSRFESYDLSLTPNF